MSHPLGRPAPDHRPTPAHLIAAGVLLVAGLPPLAIVLVSWLVGAP
jgi:hypothetical protein